METVTVQVTFALEIDRAEWQAQFPDENTPELITAEAAAHAECMVRNHYYDQGWTVKR